MDLVNIFHSFSDEESYDEGWSLSVSQNSWLHLVVVIRGNSKDEVRGLFQLELTGIFHTLVAGVVECKQL